MIKNFCISFMIFIAMLLFVQRTLAETMVPPVIDTDEHWIPDGSPYVASQGFFIQSDATLTIDPDVVDWADDILACIFVDVTISAKVASIFAL